MATALITGGHAGIGLGCARQLASQWKYNLVLAGRNPGQIEPVAQELRRTNGIQVNTLKLDASSLQSVRDAAKPLSYAPLGRSGRNVSGASLQCRGQT